MAAAFSLDAAQKHHAQQREIADNVQNLVAHELIRKAQAVFVQHPMLGEHDGIIERSSLDQICAPQGFDFLYESKGARRSNVARERAIIQSNRTMLDADERMRKIYHTINLERIGWFEADPAIARFDADGFAHH